VPARREDWGDAGEVAAAVAAAKEPLYQELTAGGIAPFPGVPQLVAQVRLLPRKGGGQGDKEASGKCANGAAAAWRAQPGACPPSLPPAGPLLPPTARAACRRERWAGAWLWPAAAAPRRLRTTWAAAGWPTSSPTATWCVRDVCRDAFVGVPHKGGREGGWCVSL
jgi:hypothetical protein